MRIDQVIAAGAAAPAGRARRTGRKGAAFALLGEADDMATEGTPEGAQAAHAAAGALPLAALQQAAPAAPHDAAARDRVAAGHGRALLGALAGLQLAALGGDCVSARRTLADLARALPQAADPGLDDVLRAIAQRAAVELARAGEA